MEVSVKGIPGMVVNRMNRFKSDMINDRSMKMLNDVVEILDLKGYKYWLSAGTALGLYRDNEYLKNDTDIDIALIGNPAIRTELEFDLCPHGFTLVRYIKYHNKYMQLAFLKDKVIIDIYLYYSGLDKILDRAIESTLYLKYFNYCERGKVVLPYEMCSNLVEIETKYGRFNFPNPTDEYLKIRYGDDWIVPQNKKGIYEKI